MAGVLAFGLAAGQGAAPEINAPYRNPDYEKWRRGFETESREVYSRRQAIVEAAQPRIGMAVADVGAGNLRRALRPGGTLVVVDFERIPGVSPDWIL